MMMRRRRRQKKKEEEVKEKRHRGSKISFRTFGEIGESFNDRRFSFLFRETQLS